jgi:hypothetical protein
MTDEPPVPQPPAALPDPWLSPGSPTPAPRPAGPPSLEADRPEVPVLPQWSTPAPVTLPPPVLGQPARTAALRVAGRLAVIGLVVMILLSLVDLVVTPMGLVDPADETVAVAVLSLAVATLVFIIGTAAAFITWLYLAMANLKTWHINGAGWTPGWAIGGWFIPLANLVIPGLVVNAAMRGSNTPANSNYAEQTSYGLVWGWWLTFVFSNCAQNAVARQDFTGADYAGVAGANGIGTVLSIVSAALGILVVRRITGLQEARQATLDGFLRP